MEHCVSIQSPTFHRQRKIHGERQKEKFMSEIYSRETDQGNPES